MHAITNITAAANAAIAAIANGVRNYELEDAYEVARIAGGEGVMPTTSHALFRLHIRAHRGEEYARLCGHDELRDNLSFARWDFLDRALDALLEEVGPTVDFDRKTGRFVLTSGDGATNPAVEIIDALQYRGGYHDIYTVLNERWRHLTQSAQVEAFRRLNCAD